jgi:hypothetical protein
VILAVILRMGEARAEPLTLRGFFYYFNIYIILVVNRAECLMPMPAPAIPAPTAVSALYVLLAPHTSGPRYVPRCGALGLLQKTLQYRGDSAETAAGLNVKLWNSVVRGGA